MNWIGILVSLAAAGALMLAAWACGLADPKSPIDPTIGFRDPLRGYLNLP